MKTERIEARVEPEVRKLISAAAELEGRSISEFLVASAKERAEETLHRHTVFRLATEDQIRFAEAILNEPPLNDAMLGALTLRQELVDPA